MRMFFHISRNQKTIVTLNMLKQVYFFLFFFERNRAQPLCFAKLFIWAKLLLLVKLFRGNFIWRTFIWGNFIWLNIIWRRLVTPILSLALPGSNTGYASGIDFFKRMDRQTHKHLLNYLIDNMLVCTYCVHSRT